MYNQPRQVAPAGNLRLLKAFFFETNTFDDQWRRPYSTNVNTETCKRFISATEHGENLHKRNIANIASEILLPSTRPEKPAAIANGWGTSRFAFVLEVEVVSQFTGSRVRKILSGWTDRCDVTFKGTMAPDTVLRFNNNVTLRDVEQVGPRGREVVTHIVENDQFILGEFTPGVVAQNEVTMRPSDVISNQKTHDHLMNDFADEEGGVVYDFSSTFCTGVVGNERKNNSAPDYVSNLFKSISHANDLAEFEDSYGDDRSFSEIYDSAKGLSQGKELQSDPVVSFLMTYGNFSHTASATLEELTQYFPNILSDTTTTVAMNDRNQRSIMRHQRGDGEDWAKEKIETIIATMLVNQLPSMAFNLLLNKVSFHFTNDTIGGQILITPIEGAIPRSLVNGLDLNNMMRLFFNEIEYTMGNSLTKNGHISLSLTVHLDTFNDCFIQVSVNNQPVVDYYYPTFADSIATPVITGNVDNLNMLSNDFYSLYNLTNTSKANMYQQPKRQSFAPSQSINQQLPHRDTSRPNNVQNTTDFWS